MSLMLSWGNLPAHPQRIVGVRFTPSPTATEAIPEAATTTRNAATGHGRATADQRCFMLITVSYSR